MYNYTYTKYIRYNVFTSDTQDTGAYI